MQEVRKNWKQWISLPGVLLDRIFSKPVVSQVLPNDVLDHGLTNSGTHPNSVSHLFLEVLQTKNGFYLFK